MHKNRIVIFKNQRFKISDILCIKPKGRQKARTIKVLWNGLSLYLTAEIRVDKHGVKSIVYLIATYKVNPAQYIDDYKKRWTIEKFFRTANQSLGLAECFSRQLIVQEKHVLSVLIAYGLAQLEMQRQKLATPEDALRAIKRQNAFATLKPFDRLEGIFGGISM